MPSLRRTTSSPSVRSSPYPTSLSLAARNPVPRRASGSDVSSRRVLAEIDWWRVEEGQKELAAGEEEAPSPSDDVPTVGVALSGPLGLSSEPSDRPVTPVLPVVPPGSPSTEYTQVWRFS